MKPDLRWAVALLASMAGCADEERATLPCDVASRACQKAVFQAATEARGQRGARLPRVRVITRDQLAAELRASIELASEELSPELQAQQRQGQAALALLGLLPQPTEQTADDAYIEQSVASIAAYYSHGSHDVTVIADQTMDLDTANITLAHEFIHALQDQRENLSELRRKYVHSTDDDVALNALVEGEATWLAYVTYADKVRDIGIERIRHESLFESILEGTLGSIEASEAPLIDATELLPYPLGGRRVAALHVSVGLSAVSALFEDPPTAVRTFIDGAPAGLPAELDCDVPASPDGYERLDTDRLGFGGLLAFRAALGEAGVSAYEGALPWRSDRIAFYASRDDPDAVAVSWRVGLDSALSASSLAAFAEASGQVEAVVQGSSVLLSAASDPGLLDAWQPGEGCTALEKSRAAEGHGPLQTLRRRLPITR